VGGDVLQGRAFGQIKGADQAKQRQALAQQTRPQIHPNADCPQQTRRRYGREAEREGRKKDGQSSLNLEQLTD
jgi:hypothetical protein